jgi:peptide-methionine (S)-S-oxide reductase
MSQESYEIATLAGGCFWCTEALFRRLKGVHSVISGYTGGKVEQPTYEQVSTGTTGHAEAIQITFDPSIISFAKLLEIFWHTHNPTTLNQQGNDVGSQYRSAIFYHNETQKQIAISSKDALEDSHTYDSPIVTQIVPFTHFYPAENYHKDYYEKNGMAPYCTLVITPKIHKLLEQYRNDIKDEFQS